MPPKRTLPPNNKRTNCGNDDNIKQSKKARTSSPTPPPVEVTTNAAIEVPSSPEHEECVGWTPVDCAHCQNTFVGHEEDICFCEDCNEDICPKCDGKVCPIFEGVGKDAKDKKEVDGRGCNTCGSYYKEGAVEPGKQNYDNMQVCDQCEQYYCAYSDSCGGIDHDLGSICFDCAEKEDDDDRCAVCGTNEDGDEHYCVGCDTRVCTRCYHPKLNDCITCVKKQKNKDKSSNLESSVEDDDCSE